MNDNAIDTTGWPKSLIALVEIVGVGAALRFMDAYAGRDYVHIPGELPEGHHLIQAVGDTAARQLVAAAGRDRLEVPTMGARNRLLRKRLIVAAEGPAPEVARRFGVTARWVRMVREERKGDDRQMDLFRED